MNLQTMQERINDALREVRFTNKSGSHVGCIRLSASCSDTHNLAITKRCIELNRLKVPYITEAIFHSGDRADLINLFTHEVEEFTHSETDKMFEEKKHRYPKMFTLKQVRV